jgi:VanZ family protein
VKVRFNPSRPFWSTALFFYMNVVLYLSLKPPARLTPGTPLQETLHNLCHVPAYAGMTFFLTGFFAVYAVRSAFFLKVFSASVLYGVLMEYLQSFVPGRTPSLSDVSLNALGTLIMIFLIRQGWMSKFFVDNSLS